MRDLHLKLKADSGVGWTSVLDTETGEKIGEIYLYNTTWNIKGTPRIRYFEAKHRGEKLGHHDTREEAAQAIYDAELKHLGIEKPAERAAFEAERDQLRREIQSLQGRAQSATHSERKWRRSGNHDLALADMRRANQYDVEKDSLKGRLAELRKSPEGRRVK